MKIGDTATWTSSAQGISKTKTGIIAEVVPAGKMPSRSAFPKLYKGAGCGSYRNHESYVVSVDVGKRVKGVSFRQYWPRVSALSKVEPF